MRWINQYVHACFDYNMGNSHRLEICSTYIKAAQNPQLVEDVLRK
jgi:hypothetical protein